MSYHNLKLFELHFVEIKICVDYNIKHPPVIIT